MTQPRQVALFPDRTAMDRAAAAFHEAHPEVMAHIVRECRRRASVGVDHWSINGAFEVVRHERTINPDPRESGEEFRLNNNHRAWYAREIMERFRDLEGFFATRARKGV